MYMPTDNCECGEGWGRGGVGFGMVGSTRNTSIKSVEIAVIAYCKSNDVCCCIVNVIHVPLCHCSEPSPSFPPPPVTRLGMEFNIHNGRVGGIDDGGMAERDDGSG